MFKGTFYGYSETVIIQVLMAKEKAERKKIFWTFQKSILFL
jgi:hypothetical protein